VGRVTLRTLAGRGLEWSHTLGISGYDARRGWNDLVPIANPFLDGDDPAAAHGQLRMATFRAQLAPAGAAGGAGRWALGWDATQYTANTLGTARLEGARAAATARR
jgi:hypothetical protein